MPTIERDDWALWVCQQLSILYGECYDVEPSSVYVLCNHIEHVKSYAPRIGHFVADIFVGPITFLNGKSFTAKRGLLNPDGSLKMQCHDSPLPLPSCALGHGKLNQEWMFDKIVI